MEIKRNSFVKIVDISADEEQERQRKLEELLHGCREMANEVSRFMEVLSDSEKWLEMCRKKDPDFNFHVEVKLSNLFCLSLLRGNIGRVVQVTEDPVALSDGSQGLLFHPKYSASIYVNSRSVELIEVPEEYRNIYIGQPVKIKNSKSIRYRLSQAHFRSTEASFYPMQEDASEEEKQLLFEDFHRKDLEVFLVEPGEGRVLVTTPMWFLCDSLYVYPEALEF